MKNKKEKINKEKNNNKKINKKEKELIDNTIITSDTKKFKLKNSQEENDISSSKQNLKKSKKKKRHLKRILYLIFFIVVMLGTCFGFSYMKWKKLAFLIFNNEPSIVYNIEHEIIAQIGAERKQENVDYSDVPENLKDAYVSIEDQRYYNHHGIDIKRTLGAILNYFTKQKSAFGGSTITQQLVKNVTGNDSNTISRKVTEWILSLELETMTSKERILEEYFNIIYLGPNVYGVKSAAEYYFDKKLDELKLEECAFLAGINHTPNSYNPFNKSDNQDIIMSRTKTVLYKMYELGYISEEEYNQAKTNTEKGLNFKKGSLKSDSDGVYSFHTDALIIELTKDLSNKYNISETFAGNLLYMGNLNIYSTESKTIQQVLETEFKKDKYILPATNEKNNSSEAAMVVIDHKSGYVLGLVGALGEKNTARGFNRATQAYRQTGSASKPLAVISPALSDNKITLSSIYTDEETIFDDNTEEGYKPINYNSYRGNISIRQAIESSQNIPFVKIIEEITPTKSIEFLKTLGITTLEDEDNNLSLALGGLSKGISPLEMAGAYSAIANNGKYISPTFYTKVTNNAGTNIIKTSQEKRRVLSKENAFLLQDLLTEPVLGTQGTAPYCRIPDMSVAAKTGTTNDNFDKWLCGFTPYYTAVTWFGYDYNEPINYGNKNPAGIIWANTMIKIHNNLEAKKFTKPSSVISLNICKETGCLAKVNCTNVYTEYFTKNNIPNDCKNHTGNLLDTLKLPTTTNTINTNNTTNTSKTTITENIVSDVIDDIKATWEEIKKDTNQTDSKPLNDTQNNTEEKTNEIVNQIIPNNDSNNTVQNTLDVNNTNNVQNNITTDSDQNTESEITTNTSQDTSNLIENIL